ncbi:hypothetical protein WKK05_04060 [Nostoc sp. UHCC 0302]|uniref:hypothetical protein n=1 Tax=Nostoc sp. UHCC 0302 TaxID=3134896 RepID=UPI00311CB92A
MLQSQLPLLFINSHAFFIAFGHLAIAILTFVIDAYEQKYRERTLKNLKKKAQVFGLELIPISNTTECVS